MPKIHQIIPLVQMKKSRAEKALTQRHHGWNSTKLMGLTRAYEPYDQDDQDRLSPEYKDVELSVRDVIRDVVEVMVPYWDIVADQGASNQVAKADIVLGDGAEPILRDVPVEALLFLERQLVNLYTFASELPVLPGDRRWEYDANRGCFVSDTVESQRSKKVQQPIVRYDATAEHPAQTEIITKDVAVGRFTAQLFSGAIPADQKKRILQRIATLQDAVKLARERANATEVVECKIGKVLLDYVFGAQFESQA